MATMMQPTNWVRELSVDAKLYQRVCRTPCSLTRGNKIRATRVLVPAPPHSLIPNYVVKCYKAHFGDTLEQAPRKATDAPASTSASSLHLLRIYGLVVATRKKGPKPKDLAKE